MFKLANYSAHPLVSAVVIRWQFQCLSNAIKELSHSHEHHNWTVSSVLGNSTDLLWEVGREGVRRGTLSLWRNKASPYPPCLGLDTGHSAGAGPRRKQRRQMVFVQQKIPTHCTCSREAWQPPPLRLQEWRGGKKQQIQKFILQRNFEPSLLAFDRESTYRYCPGLQKWCCLWG